SSRTVTGSLPLLRSDAVMRVWSFLRVMDVSRSSFIVFSERASPLQPAARKGVRNRSSFIFGLENISDREVTKAGSFSHRSPNQHFRSGRRRASMTGTLIRIAAAILMEAQSGSAPDPLPPPIAPEKFERLHKVLVPTSEEQAEFWDLPWQ